MRKLGIVVTAIACLMVSVMAYAADAPAAGAKGQFEIGLMGGIAMPMGKLAADTEDGANMKMGFGGGLALDYFVMPELAIGLDGSYVTMSNETTSDIKAKTMQYGLHAKYVIPTGGKFVPYLQVGGAMYSQKVEGVVSDLLTVTLDATKFGFNGGVGVGYKASEMVAVGVNGFYHMAGKFEPEIDGVEVEALKDWSYITFNAAVTFTIPKSK
jgi:opacity protein-like surface antigen